MRGRGATSLVVALLFAFGCASAGELAAQEPPRPTGPVTLEEALAIAQVDNPAFRRATNQLALNTPERWSYLFGQLLPSVSLDLFNTGYSGNLQRRAVDNFGNPIESPTADWVYFSNTSQSLRLNWSIQGFSLFNDMDRRDHTLLERDLSISSADWSLRNQVQRQYWDALEQRALLQVEEALRDGRGIDLESAQRRYELAGASRVDVLDAEVQVQQQEIAIEQQRGAYDRALLALRQTLGGGEVEGVADAPLPVFDPSGLEAERLIDLALESNPGLREARAGVSGARIGIREARETWWPQISLSYSLSRTAQARESQALLDLGYDEQELGSRFGIQVSVPAFTNFFQTREQQAGAEVQLANQELTLEEQRLQVEADVRAALVDLMNQWRSLQIAERSAEIAAQSTVLAREEYGLGIRTFEELQGTVEQEATTRRQELTSRYAFVDALLALEELIGAPVRPDGSPGAGGMD